MTNYNELNNNLETLNLLRMKELLPNTIEKSIKSNISLQESLLELTRAEIAFKDERAKKINITVSNFPYIKTINDFDFEYQPTINKNQILDLASLRFIEDKSNIIFVGTSGVGKTHLATSIGIEAASQRVSTYFINFAVLMEKIKKAAQENRLEQIIRHYMKYTL
jgi:DNA replication protein DnaC